MSGLYKYSNPVSHSTYTKRQYTTLNLTYGT